MRSGTFPPSRSPSQVYDHGALFAPADIAQTASLTHYDLPQGVVTSYVSPLPPTLIRARCGCTAGASAYPTAALSNGAYGSSYFSGPACGQCFNLTLQHTLLNTPQFNITPSSLYRPFVVVKITDLCPAPRLFDPGNTWCGATSNQPNKAGEFIHFDLASPSPSIPLSFFPPPPASYGTSLLLIFEMRLMRVNGRVRRFWRLVHHVRIGILLLLVRVREEREWCRPNLTYGLLSRQSSFVPFLPSSRN